MKILFLTSRVPYPPWRGDKLRTFNILKQLSKNNQIHLVSFYATKQEKKSALRLKKYVYKMDLVAMPINQSKLQVYTSFLSPRPAQVLYYHSPQMKQIVEKALGFKPDIVYCHLFRMAPYVQKARGVYKILDLTDLISLELKRSLPYRKGLWKAFIRLEALKIRLMEKKLPKYFDETWLISENEKENFVRGIKERVVLTPNGIDDNFINYSVLKNKVELNQIVFLGYFGELYNHNLDAVMHFQKDILPKIIKVIPSARFIVMGNSTNENKVGKLINNKQTQFLGFMSNLPKALAKATVLVCPLRFAAGVQNKILQAMALGVPVVTTTLGNEGVGAKPNKEIIIVDSDSAFAKKVVDILKNRKLRNEIGKNGQKFVQQKFNWQVFADRIEEIKKILNKPV